MPSRLFVVTGCGRSGTGYASSLLTALGAPCGHEAIFNPGAFLRGPTLVWPTRYAGDSSWLAAPVLGKLPDRTLVLHQVREPLAVIRSFLRIRFFDRPSPYLRFVEDHVPEASRGGAEERAMRYWIEWNRIVETAADYVDLAYRRHRLEDLDVAGVQALCAALGLERDGEAVERVLRQIPHDTNTRGERGGDEVGWDDLPRGETFDELVQLGREYGYAIEPAGRHPV